MLGLGLVCGGILAVASKVFYVYEDPRIAQVESFLAAANCGGCGYAGCSAAAVAVVNGEAPPSVCVVAGVESAINVAGVMGLDPGSAEPQRACNECQGGAAGRKQVPLFRSQLLPGIGRLLRWSADLHHWVPGTGRLYSCV